jgi:hypothetical protein
MFMFKVGYGTTIIAYVHYRSAVLYQAAAQISNDLTSPLKDVEDGALNQVMGGGGVGGGTILRGTTNETWFKVMV